jgi:ubiquinone/menaquinone biosynthesis C-methylase UbiE
VSEYISKDLRRWLDREGEEALRKIGIRRGQTILDFGCGSGSYTIPIAIIVGEEGRVYALDKDERALDELMKRAELEGLRNIRRIDTSGEVEIGLENESVDVVLLYDIFWYFPLTDNRLPKLLAEVYRVLRRDALISVYPKHTDSERLKDRIEGAGFHLNRKYSSVLIHDGKLESGQVLNFIKKDAKE